MLIDYRRPEAALRIEALSGSYALIVTEFVKRSYIYTHLILQP